MPTADVGVPRPLPCAARLRGSLSEASGQGRSEEADNAVRRCKGPVVLCRLVGCGARRNLRAGLVTARGVVSATRATQPRAAWRNGGIPPKATSRLVEVAAHPPRCRRPCHPMGDRRDRYRWSRRARSGPGSIAHARLWRVITARALLRATLRLLTFHGPPAGVAGLHAERPLCVRCMESGRRLSGRDMTARRAT